MVTNENNLQFISPALLEHLNLIKKENIEFKLSKDNLSVPVYKNTLLHSSYYPLKEAGRLDINNDSGELIIAIGIGAAYHLTKTNELNKYVIGIPVNYNILLSIINEIDFSLYFNKKKFKIITKNEILKYYNFYKFKSYRIIIHPVLEKLFPKDVLEIVRNVSSTLKNPLLDINTCRKFGKIWFKNILKNMIHFFDNKYDFSPLNIEKKAILVAGAGPSLEMNINQIKQYRDVLYIASTDSALKTLIRHNIIPDAVFTFDSQHYTYLHFAGINNNTIRVFSDFTSHIRLDYNQTILFSNHPLHIVFKNIGWDTKEINSSTRNIGGAVINFFQDYFKGFTIVTAGIDFGIYNDYIYSPGTYQEDYLLVNSDYFYTGCSMHAGLLYKDWLFEKQDNWKSNELLSIYSAECNYSEIYTLSGSPFTRFKKVNSINKVLEIKNTNQSEVLFFHKPKISKTKFIESLIQEIKMNPVIISSYFLYLEKEPDKKIVDIVIDEIYKVFN